MAGDWLKFEKATFDKPEVFAIAAELDMEPDAVVGRLLRVWAWFDTHTQFGNASSVTFVTLAALLDRAVGCAGFCEAMAKVGWLVDGPDGVSLPNFERHTGETAKRRALTARRVGKRRGDENAKCNASSVTNVTLDALPREEKRRDIDTHAPRAREKRVVGSAEIPSWPAVKAYAQGIGLAEWKAEQWFNEQEAVGWVYKGERVRNWKALCSVVRTWWEADGRPSGPQSRQPHRKSATDGVPHDAISRFGV